MGFRPPMLRSGPHLGSLALADAVAPPPPPLRLRDRGWPGPWGLGFSVLIHVGLAVAIGWMGLAARHLSQPYVLEVAVVPAAQHRSPDLEGTATTAAIPQPQRVPAPPVDEAAEAAKPQPAPPVKAPDVQPQPVPPAKAPAPEPAKTEPAKTEAAKPHPAEAAETQSAEAKPKHKPAQPESATVAHPPAPPSSPQLAERAPAEGPAVHTSHGLADPTVSGPADLRVLVRPNVRYPRIALQLQEEGVVNLVVEVGADGVPKHITISKSSGYGSLDQAAIEYFKEMRFAPPIRNGKPTAITINAPFEFKLKHANAD